MSATGEAKPSRGPKGAAARDCGEADTQPFRAPGLHKEAEA